MRADDPEPIALKTTLVSLILFGLLVWVYLWMIVKLQTMKALAEGQAAWLPALTVVLSLAAAAGLGYAYQVLKLLAEKGILKGLEGRQAAEVAKRRVEKSVKQDAEPSAVTKLAGAASTELVPVVDEKDKLIGVATARAALGAQAPKSAKELMDVTPAALGPDATLADAARLMIGSGRQAVAVKDAEGRYVGTLTCAAILQELMGSPPAKSK